VTSETPELRAEAWYRCGVVWRDHLVDEARAEVDLFLVANPHFTTGFWATTEPFRDAATLAHFVDGFHKAGLPD